MTAALVAVRWIAIDALRERATLAAALGVDLLVEDSIDIMGLRLEIVALGSLPGRAGARLEVIATDPGSGTSLAAETALAPVDSVRSTASAARFLALGWATVELERAASSWPDVRWAAAPRDSLVGARALVGRAGMPGAAPADRTESSAAAEPTAGAEPTAAEATIVLLEPDTEGRIAASLARHGEGPAVLYVQVAMASDAGMSGRLARLGIRARAGTGPFGAEWAILGPHTSSPTLVVVPEAEPVQRRPAGRPGRGRSGTIGA